MKTSYITYLLFIALAIVTFNCKTKTADPDPEPTALELQLESLMNNNTSWGLTGGSVLKDGYDVTSQFSGFTLNIGEFTYTTENGLLTAWPSTGTWQFVNDNPNKVIRGDGVEIDVAIANNQLTLTFSVTGIGGRVKGINGTYTFTLTSN